jgi:dual specificity phosphatase 12
MLSSTNPTNADRKRQLGNVIRKYLGPAKHAQRPQMPDGYDYVEPTLFGCAHMVYQNEKTEARLYVGPQLAASPEAFDSLVQAGVTAIVNCTRRIPCHFRDQGMKYCRIAIYDEAEADILTYLQGATTFLNAILTDGGSVLVHCEQGISRSASVVLAYFMRFHQMTRDQAYVEVKRRRPKINPNPGFWKQLEAFEALLQSKPVDNDDETDLSTRPFDTEWAKQCQASFATCRELPDAMQKEESWKRLALISNEKDLSQILVASLDFIWGRGLLEVDLEWLAYICQLLSSQLEDERSMPPKELAIVIVTDPNSEFTNIWSGEIYDHEVLRLRHALSPQKENLTRN